MRTLDLGHYVFSVSVAAAMLAGCEGPQATIGAPGAPPQGRVNHAEMASGSGDLLYVDQGYSFGQHHGVVVIYTYPGNAFVAKFTVSNPSYPPATTEGICSDKKGDVFIEAEYYYGTTIYEYAHGGTAPIATLIDGGNGYAMDCASDPKTGNLAVVSRAAPNSSLADVTIFKHAKGTPSTYTVPGINAYYSSGYDSQGDLFVEGNTASGIELAELTSGASTFTKITLNKTLEREGAVQWDGKYITVQDGVVIYRVSISGSTATVVGTTRTRHRSEPGRLDYIYHDQIIAPDGKEHQDGRIGFWSYPTGKPVGVLVVNGVSNLYSATVSVALNR
jgi:hypothetical protein